MSEELIVLATRLSKLLITQNKKVVTAESCTGGWIAQILTSIPGSSAWFDRGIVAYSNLSKTQMLGVSPGLIEQYGAVSEATVRAMAEGALHASQAQVSLAVTGIAGPEGGSDNKPVGTVWFGYSGDYNQQTKTAHYVFSGDRMEIRYAAVKMGLEALISLLDFH